MKWSGRYAGYNMAGFRKDLLSGLVVAILAIPLGMAFAIACGVKPEYGIYTIIISGIVISLCGGSRFQIGGPTGAFIPILLAVVIKYGYANLLIAGFLAGIMLVLLGIFKMGTFIKFIPHSVIIGFTSGIAVIIYSGQIANFLGLAELPKHEQFGASMLELARHLSETNLFSLLTAAVCLFTILITSKLLPKLPSFIIGLVISSLLAALFFDGRVATIGSSFGTIPGSLPHFQFPALSWNQTLLLIGPAAMIAMLGGIESLLSAVVADRLTGTNHDSNRELIGQGVANLITPLFGGIPATGAIARTAANIKNGAVSPISGIIHGVLVMLVLLLFAPAASAIPLASMAPLLMVVAWNMSERKQFIALLKSRSADSIVVIVTFGLTVFSNVTAAVAGGVILAYALKYWNKYRRCSQMGLSEDIDQREESKKHTLDR